MSPWTRRKLSDLGSPTGREARTILWFLDEGTSSSLIDGLSPTMMGSSHAQCQYPRRDFFSPCSGKWGRVRGPLRSGRVRGRRLIDEVGQALHGQFGLAQAREPAAIQQAIAFVDHHEP